MKTNKLMQLASRMTADVKNISDQKLNESKKLLRRVDELQSKMSDFEEINLTLDNL